jgi:hypothetical protein
MKRSMFVGFSIVWMLLIGGCTATPKSTQTLVASDDVPTDLAEEARLLAEQHPTLASIMLKARVVYISTETTRWKTKDGEEDLRKIFLVSHYRYDNDAAIRSLVNLSDATVLDQREIPHLPVSLAQEELDTASALALKDARVSDALGSDRESVEIEALVIRSASEDDPWFGRRVVQLLFRVDRDYRHSPRVVVDLTNNVVLIETEGEFK